MHGDGLVNSLVHRIPKNVDHLVVDPGPGLDTHLGMPPKEVSQSKNIEKIKSINIMIFL